VLTQGPCKQAAVNRSICQSQSGFVLCILAPHTPCHRAPTIKGTQVPVTWRVGQPQKACMLGEKLAKKRCAHAPAAVTAGVVSPVTSPQVCARTKQQPPQTHTPPSAKRIQAQFNMAAPLTVGCHLHGAPQLTLLPTPGIPCSTHTGPLPGDMGCVGSTCRRMHAPQSPSKATKDGNRCNWFSCTQPRATPGVLLDAIQQTENGQEAQKESAVLKPAAPTRRALLTKQSLWEGAGDWVVLWQQAPAYATSTSLRNKHQATQEAPAYITSTAHRMYTCSPPEGRHNQPCPPQASKVEQDRSPKVNGVELASRAAVELHHTEDSKPNAPPHMHAASLLNCQAARVCAAINQARLRTPDITPHTPIDHNARPVMCWRLAQCLSPRSTAQHCPAG
jgi:hypothetical protein